MRARLYELRLKEGAPLQIYRDQHSGEGGSQADLEAQPNWLERRDHRTDVTTAVNPTYQQLDLTLIRKGQPFLPGAKAGSSMISWTARSEIRVINDTELRIVNLQRKLALEDAKHRKYAETGAGAHRSGLETKKISISA